MGLVKAYRRRFVQNVIPADMPRLREDFVKYGAPSIGRQAISDASSIRDEFINGTALHSRQEMLPYAAKLDEVAKGIMELPFWKRI